MSDVPDEMVTCEVHGETLPTFTCVHLASAGSAGLGTCYDRTSEEPWPDLVCNACSDEPEWSDELAAERIRLLCGRCWDDAFGKNTGAHHPDPETWLRDAAERALRRQRQWTGKYGIQEAKHYRYQLEETPPWLGFGPSDEKFEILCEPTVLGSWSARSGTWLWGWANSWWHPAVTRPVVTAKRAGERLGIERLRRSGFDGDEAMAWEACLAALDLLPEFSGIYRSPGANGALFLATRNTRLVT